MVALSLPEDPALETWPASGEFAILDAEYTAWEGSMARLWSEPWEFRELIQIGAIRLTGDTYIETGCFETLIRPTRNPVLSDYIVRLTGITDAMIRRSGISFSDAIARLRDFLRGIGTVLVNGLDGVVLRENCQFNGADFDLGGPKFVNLRPTLAQVMNRPAAELMSNRLPELVGLPEPSTKHTGLADARAIAAALRELRRSGRL